MKDSLKRFNDYIFGNIEKPEDKKEYRELMTNIDKISKQLIDLKKTFEIGGSITAKHLDSIPYARDKPNGFPIGFKSTIYRLIPPKAFEDSFMFKVEVLPGGFIPSHNHPDLIENIYILSGESFFDGNTMKEGSSVEYSAKEYHEIKNFSSTPAQYIMIFTPLD